MSQKNATADLKWFAWSLDEAERQALLDRFTRAALLTIFGPITMKESWSAAEGGKTAAQVIADLSVCSQNAVPQNVAVTIREWMGEGRPAHLTIGWLLEVDEAETAQAILTDRTLHRYVERAVGPTALLLRPGVSEEQISTALRKAGFFPRITR